MSNTSAGGAFNKFADASSNIASIIVGGFAAEYPPNLKCASSSALAFLPRRENLKSSVESPKY